MLSLVVATVGRVSEFDRLLDSLLEQTSKRYELIFVDQNEDDRLLPIVARARETGVPVQHLRLHPPNLSAARNAGIQAASGASIGFPDDDCWYEPDTVECVNSSLASNTSSAGIVGRWIEQQAGLAFRSEDADQLSVKQWRQFRGGDASSITLFFRTSAVRDLGGFDTRLGVGGWFACGEETDLVIRALQSGLQIRRTANIRVHHRFNTTRQAISVRDLRRVRMRERGIGALYAKHSLSFFVVVRGLSAGWLKPLLRWEGLGSFCLGISQSLGRLEGFVRWKIMRENSRT